MFCLGVSEPEQSLRAAVGKLLLLFHGFHGPVISTAFSGFATVGWFPDAGGVRLSGRHRICVCCPTSEAVAICTCTATTNRRLIRSIASGSLNSFPLLGATAPASDWLSEGALALCLSLGGRFCLGRLSGLAG